MKNQILDFQLEENKRRPLNPGVLTVTLIGIGAFIGATTNLINGNVSEEYFRRVMAWRFNEIWKAAVLQGIFEGLIFGLILGIIFTAGFAIITKLNADWRFARRPLNKMIFVIYGCWIVGGMVAIILALAFPEELDRKVYLAPKETMPRIRFYWVGGSIWGGIAGGIISVIYGLIMTNQEWEKAGST